MIQSPLFRLVSLGLLSAVTACQLGSGAEPEPAERERVPVEFHENGFAVGQVTYSGVCHETEADRCEAERSECWATCSAISYQYAASCAGVCSSGSCLGKSRDVCFDYEADFDFGRPDFALADACVAWWDAQEASCGVSRPQGYCFKVAITWRPDSASVFLCSAEQAQAGVCAESCVLPASTFGDELCAAAREQNVECSVGQDAGNLLGGVLRADVIEAAWACLAIDDNVSAGRCLQAWRDEVVP